MTKYAVNRDKFNVTKKGTKTRKKPRQCGYAIARLCQLLSRLDPKKRLEKYVLGRTQDKLFVTSPIFFTVFLIRAVIFKFVSNQTSRYFDSF